MVMIVLRTLVLNIYQGVEKNSGWTLFICMRAPCI